MNTNHAGAFEGSGPDCDAIKLIEEVLISNLAMYDVRMEYPGRFFAGLIEAAARELETINAQRNDLAHGRKSLSLVEMKKHVIKGLKLEARARILENHAEFKVSK